MIGSEFFELIDSTIVNRYSPQLLYFTTKCLVVGHESSSSGEDFPSNFSFCFFPCTFSYCAFSCISIITSISKLDLGEYSVFFSFSVRPIVSFTKKRQNRKPTKEIDE